MERNKGFTVSYPCIKIFGAECIGCCDCEPEEEEETDEEE